MDIELGDAVAALRDELVAAADRGVDSGLRFVVGPIELAFDVELRRDGKGKFGFKAWVVTGEVEVGAARTSRQRVTVTLTPQVLGGGDYYIGRDAADGAGPGNTDPHIGR